MNESHEKSLGENVRGPAPREKLSNGKERRPTKTSGWREARQWSPPAEMRRSTISISAWLRREVFFISALELAEAPDQQGDAIPQWHVSISQRLIGGSGSIRATDHQVAQTLACLGLQRAEEDNHHPGIARHFWLPVDATRRVECECKTTETVITEEDGYTYSEKHGTCAGCELEVTTGQPCARHSAVKLKDWVKRELGKPEQPPRSQKIDGTNDFDLDVPLRRAPHPDKSEE